ncbi:hypothetical protein BCR34DRAFT_674383 [Clohesyomyces aquaticus]|uniref:Glucose-methanol-choline oxidoreductase C-terminal domain-containing protein n=1 Tax=Clohesyomyces aquaticus TaxID=1231657 RepID=A0A1Y1ZIQ2_9PLEO|nr:hypothetical protein BCR34DRAFT_674383 [Clohesyomyces aquaticus]
MKFKNDYATVRVVVLEAGEDMATDHMITTPALFRTLLGSAVDWNIAALGNKTIAIPHGKAHTLHVPTNPAVREHLHLDYVDENICGHSGPIHARSPEDLNNPLPKAWIQALNTLNHPSSAYLAPMRHQSNLTVITDANVQMINLLELSFIGSASLLNGREIPVHVENPHVEENLQDHPMTGMSFEVREDLSAFQAAMEQCEKNKSGPLAVAGILLYAFLPPQEIIVEENGKSLRKLVERISYSNDSHPMKQAHTSSLMTSNFLPGSFYSIALCLLQPLSRGNVNIQSKDPNILVKEDINYLSYSLGLKILAHYMQYTATIIIETDPLKPLLKEGAGGANLSSWHPASMCAMCRSSWVVHGTKNLRVVDANMFLIPSRANPVATVYAVAEKPADLIKGSV